MKKLLFGKFMIRLCASDNYPQQQKKKAACVSWTYQPNSVGFLFFFSRNIFNTDEFIIPHPIQFIILLLLNGNLFIIDIEEKLSQIFQCLHNSDVHKRSITVTTDSLAANPEKETMAALFKARKGESSSLIWVNNSNVYTLGKF